MVGHALSLPRFYVVETRGWWIAPPGRRQIGTSKPAASSFAVLDRLYCHREVGRFDAPNPLTPLAAGSSASRRRRAGLLAAQLNAKHAVLEPAG